MKNVLVSVALLAACGAGLAKLPPPDDAAKAKAAEASARTGWQAKVDAFQLCRSQDRVVSHYRKTAATAPPPAGRAPTHPGAAPSAQGTGAPVAAASPTSPQAPAAAPSTAATPAGAPGAVPAIAAAGAAPSTPCADPGPFAYTPPEQKPLEVSGAHSPAGTAVSPPSTNTPAAAIDPAKK